VSQGPLRSLWVRAGSRSYGAWAPCYVGAARAGGEGGSRSSAAARLESTSCRPRPAVGRRPDADGRGMTRSASTESGPSPPIPCGSREAFQAIRSAWAKRRGHLGGGRERVPYSGDLAAGRRRQGGGASSSARNR
jgi:hypothetical protein